MGKPIWGDESVGLVFGRIHGYGYLLLNGSGEASPSPLFYILDLVLWDVFRGEPQYWWDLRFFSRILPAGYWALAGTYVFYWCLHRSVEVLKLPFAQAVCLGAGISFFLHSCSFMNIYAIEDRAYSLWVSLSTVQFLVWLDLGRNPLHRGTWIRFSLLSALMVFTTFSALGQVGIGVIAVVVLCWADGSRMNAVGLRKTIWRAGGVLAVCTFIGFFYFRNSPVMAYSAGGFAISEYFESVFEVLAKSFHQRSVSVLAISLPLLLFVLPIVRRRDKAVLAFVGYNFALILLSFVYFKGAEARGGLWASRYVIFLIPSFVGLYVFGIGIFLHWLGRAIFTSRFWKWRSPGAWSLIVLWAILQASGSGKKYFSDILADWPRLNERKVFAYNPSGKCRDLAGPDFAAEAFEALNDLCRGIAPNPVKNP